MINILDWIRKRKKPKRHHEWEQLERLSVRLDYSGFEKAFYRCKCKKCGKIEIRSYW